MSLDDQCGDDASSILYQNNEHGVIVLDIPRSIEEAQVPSQCLPSRRLISTEPPTAPFENPEPQDSSAYSMHSHGPFASQLADLMTAESVTQTVSHLENVYIGPYFLPRITSSDEELSDKSHVMPPDANYTQGLLQDTRDAFCAAAPKFDLILMDPPWPNRSARRKKGSYNTANSVTEIRKLLSAIPVTTHLKDDGLVAVWITNRPSILDLMTSPTGIFAQWGLELVTEWTWLKVTASGKPLFSIDSAWRKPWEKLLIAKRRVAPKLDSLSPRIIVAAPDLHSRKPNLRGLFDKVLGQHHSGLEVFARHLTSGWWSWGDQVLLFQEPQHWIAHRNSSDVDT